MSRDALCAYVQGMTVPPERPPASETEIRRSKLIGRLIILGFGALLLLYFVPLALNFILPKVGAPATQPPSAAPPR